MLPKHICAASSGHAHACAYTQIACIHLDSMSAYGIGKALLENQCQGAANIDIDFKGLACFMD